MLRPKLVLLLTEIFQYWLCLRNTTSFIPPRYQKSRGTSHYIKKLEKRQKHYLYGVKCITIFQHLKHLFIIIKYEYTLMIYTLNEHILTCFL